MSRLNKKLMCLFLLLLVGCASLPATPPFVYNQECPHVCWLSINPSATTMEEARKLLRDSRQISNIDEDDTGISVKWRAKQMGEKPIDVSVGIVGENGIVSAVNFLFPGNITVKYFIDLLGEPDEI